MTWIPQPVQASSGEELSDADRTALGTPGTAQFLDLMGRLTQGLQTLDDKPEETPYTALRALWLLVCGRPISAQAAAEHALVAISAEQKARLDGLVERRLQGTPLAHLTGVQRFMGIELLAGPQALIPRRETELLGWAAADLLDQATRARGTAIAVDVCTGSGNIAIGLASVVPSARVFASDLSEDAVQLARRNVEHVGLAHRIEVRQGDLLAPFDAAEFLGNIDVLVCNPPYISSGKVTAMPAEIADFEPQLAFDGGPFGIRILNRLIQESPRYLRPGGWLAFEVGAGQGPSTFRRLSSTGRFGDIQLLEDEKGGIRALRCRLLSP